MANKRKYASPKDPRKRDPGLRASLRKKIFATQSICGICGKPVDTTLPAHLPLSPELDEIIPVARGGSPHDIDNLQLTHKICNQKKGAKLPSDNQEKIKNEIPNSKIW